MIDARIVAPCRSKLIEVAQRYGRITYAESAQYLGVANQSVGIYLDAIYEDETAQNRPDLTVVVVYSKTGFGRYNSRGRAARSVTVDPTRQDDVRIYMDELAPVYDCWSRY